MPTIQSLFALCDPVTSTFWPQNHITCRISQGHSLYQIWTLWDHSFLSDCADKQTPLNALLTQLRFIKSNYTQHMSHLIECITHAGHSIAFSHFVTSDIILIDVWGLLMDYPRAKFSDLSFSRCSFIVRTDRQTHTQTLLNTLPHDCYPVSYTHLTLPTIYSV